MRTALPRPIARAPRRGVTMLVVLILLSVMLLGGLGLARMTETGTLSSGNNAARDASLHASEVGINTAYEAVKAVTAANEGSNAGDWYFATTQTADAAGMPGINWNNAPEVVVGAYAVRYAVERMCTVAAVTDTLKQCLVRQVPQIGSASDGKEAVDPPNARQFRITVRVLGPKNAETWVQTLVTKG
jgi:Tfp pilus assembly protein PilX